MTSARGNQIGDKYVLPTGNDDAARLDVIHAVYGAVSEKGLERASINNAARAADIGCGTGAVSRWMASRMGPAARVDAIDIAPEQIEVAKGIEVEGGASPIYYHLGSAYEPGLPEDVYDVVFCRLVLCHLKDPQKAVAQMARLLRPGGRLVLVDMDLRDTFTMPHCASYPAYINECVIPYQTKINVDYSVGLKLPQLIMDAGLKTDFITADQPILRDGPGKHLWEKTWTFALQRAVPEGVVTMERGMELIAGMEKHTANPEVWVAVAKMFAAVGKKPLH
jgi:2-polyprenyl-3-methyl-5-hydroxy-6-metoxy-1,4-benzoquinol methylase